MKKLILFLFVIFLLSGCSASLQSESDTKSADQMAREIGEQVDNVINQEEADEMAEEMGKQIENVINQEEADNDAREIGEQLDKALAQEEADEMAEEMGKQIENTINQEEADNDAREIGEQLDKAIKDNNLPEDKKKAMRSCNAIENSSTCIEYKGSFWSEAQKEYHCKGSGVLSDKLCESGNIGGCRIGGGSPSDMIVWMYPYGGEPIETDSVKSAKMGCDMNPMGSWQEAQ